ncbi:MAG: PqqD family protein [Ruminococcaceae bacterium]|nr:PqqD family protein [Oscillospiraceae bacterium]
MKIKSSFILKKILDDYIVVPVGEELVNFDAMITLNETGAFLWELLNEEKTEEELLKELCSVYDVSEEDAKKDISNFIALLQQTKVLE